ncbi:hypothetical protein FPHYL_1019 [Fusarium phyllophilum]|uniref:Uncharacterized protein n=1 Tax=Fusarium phyllophilum TaxID=47803 RepID=A0A8H5KAI0_9HYPO|nr:hypothetical protein FPHYL_1019 [Fusarium phyllophilum]
MALKQDYRRDWVIRWLRQFLMFVNLALSCVSGVFVLESVSKGLDDKTLPIPCVWEVEGKGAASNAGLSYVGTIVVIAVGAAIRIILLSQAFGHPSIELKDNGETVWSFGQLLSMLLLILPLVNVIEIYRGEIQVPGPIRDERAKVYDGELQDNPQGSRTNLFQK